MTPVIVVIAYNRPEALKRLLGSLSHAEYPEDEKVSLIISIDRAADEGNAAVLQLASDYEWRYGEKHVVYREENLGLKRHVLLCGDYSLTFGSAILLEDDLFVSPAFYSYAAAALNFSEKDQKIGGVSLYNHLLNVHVREPFEAIDDCSDNWYFQFASSWGQAVTNRQWRAFRDWLALHDNEELTDPRIPENVRSWSAKSWLKYHIAFLIDTDRLFLYPRISYTTNFSDAGTHAKEIVNDLQVPLSARRKGVPFYFLKPEETRSVYDAFFENLSLRETVAEMITRDAAPVSPHRIGIDLYGSRPVEQTYAYFLSSESLPYRQIRQFARRLRPIDENIFTELAGDDFYLYDLSQAGKQPKTRAALRLLYHYRAISVGKILKILKYRLRQR